MSKHKHYNMIVAKAANMDLVVFYKAGNDWYFDDTSESYNFLSDIDYFLCLPQFTKECLHWLNGGEVQYQMRFDEWADASNNVSNASWSKDNMFMTGQAEFRIKPKKVKCWIAIHGDKIEFFDNRVIYPPHAQFIEIEVEE